MRRAAIHLIAAALFVFIFTTAQSPAYAGGSAMIVGLYPAAEVPIGAKVTFSVISTGFTNPTYYLVDSFPGGVTSANLDNLGDFSWTPNKDDVGTHSLTITVSDSAGDSASVSQQLVVDASARISIQSLAPGAAVNIGTPVSFTAVASGLLTPAYSVADLFSNSSMQSYAMAQSGAFVWTPVAQDIGTHTVIVTAKDTYGNLATSSTLITVLPSSTASITGLMPGTSVNAGQMLSFVATSTGFVNPLYAVSDSSGTGTSTLNIDNSGKASWYPQYNDIGMHHIIVTISDSAGRSGSASLVITVLPPLPISAAQTTTPTSASTTKPIPLAAPAPTTSPVQKATVQASSPQKTMATATLQTGTANAPATTVTATSSTNPSPHPVVQPTTTNTFLDSSTIPAVPSSFGQYLLDGVVNFFVSLFKLF